MPLRKSHKEAPRPAAFSGSLQHGFLPTHLMQYMAQAMMSSCGQLSSGCMPGMGSLNQWAHQQGQERSMTGPTAPRVPLALTMEPETLPKTENLTTTKPMDGHSRASTPSPPATSSPAAVETIQPIALLSTSSQENLEKPENPGVSMPEAPKADNLGAMEQDRLQPPLEVKFKTDPAVPLPEKHDPVVPGPEKHKGVKSALLSLDEAMEKRETDKRGIPKSGAAMKRPAAKGPTAKAKAKAASAKASNVPKKVMSSSKPVQKAMAKTKVKKNAKSKSKPFLRPWPSQKEMKKWKPTGCSKCRNVPGCTTSCWVQRRHGPPPSK